MKIVAYAAEAYAEATKLALKGRTGLYTCPPYGNQDFLFQPHLLQGYDLVVFNLHGLHFEPAWYGDAGKLALTATTLRAIDLRNTGIFAINCHLGDPFQPMFKELRKSGASYVIAGEGINYGGTIRPVGADIVLRWFVTFLPRMDPESALKRAKILARISAPKWTKMQRIALQDALKFKLWRSDKAE